MALLSCLNLLHPDRHFKYREDPGDEVSSETQREIVGTRKSRNFPRPFFLLSSPSASGSPRMGTRLSGWYLVLIRRVIQRFFVVVVVVFFVVVVVFFVVTSSF